MTNAPYDATFFKGQRDASMVAAKQVLPLAFSVIPCMSLLDVGCGVGPWVAAAQELGVPEAVGVDGSYVDRQLLLISEQHFVSSDLTKPLELHRKFDLVISMEVAEHIDPSAAGLFIDNLVRHSDAVLFSAAIPGQGGTFHVNEQWPEYWRAKFAAREYQQFDVIRNSIWENREVPCCYRQNTYLYVNSRSLGRFPALLQADLKNSRPVACIHPEVFAEALGRPLALRRIFHELPAALRRTLEIRGRKLLKGFVK